MKKAGIITMHNCNNLGASLQAYATLKNFETLGVEGNLINYTPPCDKDKKAFLSPPTSISRIRHDLKNLIYPRSFIKRNRNFNKFTSEYLNVTQKEYSIKNYFEIQKENFDFFVTGSDQTFAMNLQGDPEFRKPFFLPFDVNGKKISYSSSMGEKIKDLSSENIAFIKENLSKYDALSVREDATADYIESLIEKRPVVTFDPTITLSKEEWEKIEKPVDIKEKYIFFYTVISVPWVIEYVKELSKKTGLKVVTPNPINPAELNTDFIRINTAGPSEFLFLLKNSEMVITSSFHGTIFSIIYEKPFASLITGEGNRINTLLKLADMQEFGYRENQKNEIEIFTPDIDKVKALIEKAKKTNEDYLKQNL